jgi:gentisate 1,2-dioxygenase
MKTWTTARPAAQGDLFLRRIDKLPANAKPMETESGAFIVAHSETGHNHIIKERPGVKVYVTDDPMVSYLEVIEATEKTEALLEHLRVHDTHETLAIPPGVFELRRQREHTPEGWRRVAD